MNTPYIAEFRKKLSAAHKRKISNSLRKRNAVPFNAGEALDKAILRTTHIANSSNNLTKAYYNVARGAKDFQLVKKYKMAREIASRPVPSPSRLSLVGGFLDSGLRRGEAASRIGSRVSGDRFRGRNIASQIASRGRSLDLRERGLSSAISDRGRGLNLRENSINSLISDRGRGLDLRSRGLEMRGMSRKTSRWNKKGKSWVAQTLSQLI